MKASVLLTFYFQSKNERNLWCPARPLRHIVLCPGGNDPRYCKIGSTYCDITYTNAHTQKHTQMLHWTVLKNGWYKILFHDSKWSPTCPPQTFKIDAICGGVQTHTLDWASGISDMLLFTVRCFLQLFGFVEQSALFLSPSQHTHFFPGIYMFREKLLCKLYLINVSIFIQVYMECMLGQ